jgi:hypothetical protein
LSKNWRSIDVCDALGEHDIQLLIAEAALSLRRTGWRLGRSHGLTRSLSHLGKPVAILIDGSVVIAPTVKSAIGAAAIISGDYTQADAQRIAAGITGAAP